MIAVALLAMTVACAPPAAARRSKAPYTATIGWSNGARWGGKPLEIDELTYGTNFEDEALPQVVVRLVEDEGARTAVLQSFDDVEEQWVTEDVQRTRDGVAKLTPNPWCSDEDGNEVWCDSVFRYRVRIAASGMLRARSSRISKVLFTPYTACYPWDAWLCDDGGDW